jgi:hypothetical protein
VNQVELPIVDRSPLRTPLALMLGDRKFRAGLIDWIHRRIGHMEDSEDVLGLASERALRRERDGVPWNPDGKTTAGLHMIKFIKGALADRQKTMWRRRGSMVEDIDQFASEDTSPGDRAARRLEAGLRRRLANELHQDLVATGKDPVAAEILEAWAAGVIDHSEIATRSRRPLAEIRAGLKRLERYAQATIETFRQQARFQ